MTREGDSQDSAPSTHGVIHPSKCTQSQISKGIGWVCRKSGASSREPSPSDSHRPPPAMRCYSACDTLCIKKLIRGPSPRLLTASWSCRRLCLAQTNIPGSQKERRKSICVVRKYVKRRYTMWYKPHVDAVQAQWGLLIRSGNSGNLTLRPSPESRFPGASQGLALWTGLSYRKSQDCWPVFSAQIDYSLDRDGTTGNPNWKKNRVRLGHCPYHTQKSVPNKLKTWNIQELWSL